MLFLFVAFSLVVVCGLVDLFGFGFWLILFLWWILILFVFIVWWLPFDLCVGWLWVCLFVLVWVFRCLVWLWFCCFPLWWFYDFVVRLIVLFYVYDLWLFCCYGFIGCRLLVLEFVWCLLFWGWLFVFCFVGFLGFCCFVCFVLAVCVDCFGCWWFVLIIVFLIG